MSDNSNSGNEKNFKPGDRVRYVGVTTDGLTHGRVYTVCEVDFSGFPTVIDGDGDLRDRGKDEWEKAEDAAKAPESPVQGDLTGEGSPGASEGVEVLWGPEIAVDGKRPEWLGDEEKAEYWHRSDPRWGPTTNRARWDGDDWECVVKIRLPASHPYYTVQAWNAAHPDEAPFEYWHGGEEAPGDWDGVEEGALLRSGVVGNAYRWNNVGRGSRDCDIIGYRRRAEAVVAQGHDAGKDTVTLERMTEAEARGLWDAAYDRKMRAGGMFGNCDVAAEILRDLGLVKEEPQDTSLQDAREICAQMMLERYNPDLGQRLADIYRSGGYDEGNEMTIALRALEKGRGL